MTINIPLYRAVTIANLVGFTAGLAYGWSSPVLPKLNGNVEPENNPLPQPTTSSEEAWITGLLSIGAIFGPIFSSQIADRFGRKKTLFIIVWPTMLSYFMMAFSNSVLLFCVGRVLKGFGVGSMYMMLPVYLVEIAEDHNRGFIGCLLSVFATTGTLFAYAVGPYLSVQNFCLLCTVPLIIFVPTFLIWNPETPLYLASVGDQQRLKHSLVKLRNKPVGEIEKDMEVLGKAMEEINQNKGGIRELFRYRHLRKGLMLTVGIEFFQQFTGINTVLSYMQSIFDSAGTRFSPQISSMIVGVIQILATIITSGLADKLGRKTLLAISLLGSGLSLIVLGTYFFLQDKDFDLSAFFWVPITSLMAFILSFNLGLASVPWTFMAEIFPPNVKSVALTLTVVVCFVGASLTTLCFPFLAQLLGTGQSFWFFSVISIMGAGFIVCLVPETKGKSLLEIQDLLGRS